MYTQQPEGLVLFRFMEIFTVLLQPPPNQWRQNTEEKRRSRQRVNSVSNVGLQKNKTTLVSSLTYEGRHCCPGLWPSHLCKNKTEYQWWLKQKTSCSRSMSLNIFLRNCSSEGNVRHHLEALQRLSGLVRKLEGQKSTLSSTDDGIYNFILCHDMSRCWRKQSRQTMNKVQCFLFLIIIKEYWLWLCTEILGTKKEFVSGWEKDKYSFMT